MSDELNQNQEQELEKKYYKLDFAKFAQLVYKDLKETTAGTDLLSRYKKDDIIRYIQTPVQSEKILRQISNSLYNLSSHYKRLIKYFTDMARYDYVIEMAKLEENPKSPEDIKKNFYSTCNYIDVMNIKHEFDKISKCVFREDIFYGYEYHEKNSYFIQKLNPDFCKISGIADSILTFRFDFSYFKGKNEELLDSAYGEEFREKYELYKQDAKKYRWQELDIDHCICIKLNEELEYPMPFFASLFLDIMDIQEYKGIKKSSELLQNYCILVAKIPMNEKSDKANDFMLTLDTAISYGQKAIESLPDEVGFILSPYDKVEAIHLNKNQNDKNAVDDAEESFSNAAGVQKSIFNSKNVSAEIVRKAIVKDEALVFSLYRQYERWLNRKLKLHNKSMFRLKIINTSEYNYGDVYKRYKEAASYGVPVKFELAASLGMTPSAVIGNMFLENNVFNFAEEFQPLQSSNTMSPDKGRPGKEDVGGEIDSGEKSNPE